MKKRWVTATAVASLVLTAAANAAKPVKVDFEPFFYSGYEIADCGSFKVMWDGWIDTTSWTFFNNQGEVVRTSSWVRFSDTVFYNSNDPSYYLTGGPSEIEIDRFNGNYWIVEGIPVNVTVPGYGVIWHWPGRMIRDLTTGEIVFQAGPPTKNMSDVSALCAALSP